MLSPSAKPIAVAGANPAGVLMGWLCGMVHSRNFCEPGQLYKEQQVGKQFRKLIGDQSSSETSRTRSEAKNSL